MKRSYLLALAASLFILNPCHAIKKSSIYVAPTRPTPESDTVFLRIAFPSSGEVVSSLPVQGQVRLEGYPLGTYSQFNRAKQILNNAEGQALQVVIDNLPHFSLYLSFEDSFDENRNFLDQIVSFKFPDSEVPMNLGEGMHVMRIFPVRSFYESLKNPQTFGTTYFYLGEKKGDLKIDFSKPFITYNMPQGSYPKVYSNPILLDFILHNCKLSKEGYKALLTIDRTFKAKLTYPPPYFIYGLSEGEHTIRLELIDARDKPVTHVNGLFNVTERIIQINESSE